MANPKPTFSSPSSDSTHTVESPPGKGFPSPNISRYMKFIALLGQFPSLFQIIKILQTHSSGDISVPGLIVALFCSLSWLMYGFYLHDKPLILSSILACLLTITNITVTILYK